MTSHMLTAAKLEFLAASRLRWVRLLAIAFGVLTAASAHAAGAAIELRGADGFARTTLALVPVVLVLVPLSALLLGCVSQSADPDGDQFLFSQPISRLSVVVGRWMGDAAAMASAIGLGLGSGGLYVATMAGTAGLPAFCLFVGISVLLAIIFLALAAAIAAATARRGTALAAAAFAWFFFVLLYDGVALSCAAWLTGPSGGRVLFASVFGNPTDLARLLMLSVSGTPNVLGAAGDAWTRFLGGPNPAILLSLGGLTAWAVAPLGVATFLMRRRDL